MTDGSCISFAPRRSCLATPFRCRPTCLASRGHECTTWPVTLAPCRNVWVNCTILPCASAKALSACPSQSLVLPRLVPIAADAVSHALLAPNPWSTVSTWKNVKITPLPCCMNMLLCGHLEEELKAMSTLKTVLQRS